MSETKTQFFRIRGARLSGTVYTIVYFKQEAKPKNSWTLKVMGLMENRESININLPGLPKVIQDKLVKRAKSWVRENFGESEKLLTVEITADRIIVHHVSKQRVGKSQRLYQDDFGPDNYG